jgi:hypothetical protein
VAQPSKGKPRFGNGNEEKGRKGKKGKQRNPSRYLGVYAKNGRGPIRLWTKPKRESFPKFSLESARKD